MKHNKRTFIAASLLVILLVSTCSADFLCPIAPESSPIAAGRIAEAVDDGFSASPRAASLGVITPSSQAAAATDKKYLHRPEGWQIDSHTSDVDPTYEIVFPESKVNRIDIVVSAESWEAMLSDMTDLDGEFGSFVRNADEIAQMYVRKPGWVEAKIIFRESVWTHVGLRFKGDLSLRVAWRSGSLKLPFKIDFDKFEEQFPEIDDQRFYGFNQLTLDNNFRDNSFLREKLASDVYAAAGVPVAKSAFYKVYIDHGEGAEYFGLYTMVEVVEDTVIDREFGNDRGNIYEADGAAASLAIDTFEQIPESFEKENNSKSADWNDIEALFTNLHASNRTTEPKIWRSNLESVLNVHGFLKWLAVTTLIQNWDTYGNRPHNFYLYHNQETGQFEWISWDHDKAFKGNNMTLSLDLREVNEQWPLIRSLMDDDVYRMQYETYLEEVASGVFQPESMKAKYAAMHALISPHVTREVDGDVFTSAMNELRNHNSNRYNAVQAYLDSLQ